MPRFRTLLVVALLACAAPLAFAQQSLQQEMTAEEFAAAGLDKLSAAELDVLNRWLQRQVEVEKSVVVEQAREEGRQQAQVEAAGRDGSLFGGSGPREQFQSNIVGEFSGFGRGQRYTLANGQVWEQVDSARLDGVRQNDPQVTVSPGIMGSWSLRVDGYNTRAKVRRVN